MSQTVPGCTGTDTQSIRTGADRKLQCISEATKPILAGDVMDSQTTLCEVSSNRK